MSRGSPIPMEVMTKDEMKVRKTELHQKILNGSVFIHPTDTIYGLGCNATDRKAVAKIRELKKRPKTPFSVMAPNKEWIYNNCDVPKSAETWIKKLPGPYTFIFKLNNKKAVVSNVNPGLDSIGVRIPDHWIHDLASGLNIPIITTSANRVEEEFMTSLDNLDPRIKGRTNFILYEGEKRGHPSQIVDFTGEKRKIIKR